MGLVFGAFELGNVTFDELFFHVVYLYNIVCEDECDSIDTSDWNKFNRE